MSKKDVEKVKEEIGLEKLPGVGPATLEKLRESGFVDLMQVAVADIASLCEAAEIGEAAAKKIIFNARKSLNMGFTDASVIEEKRKEIFYLSTGSQEFNKLLAGGVESGAITECYGEFGSSKTQIAHQIAVNVQLSKDRGGMDGMCVYIDTEGSFRPQRIRQMAKALGLDEEKVLKNIKYARAYNSEHQTILSEKVEELLKVDKLPIRLIIVDSLTSLFRSEFVGRGCLADRQSKLNRHMKTLARLADIYNLVVYVTNQVSVTPDVFYGDPTRPIGGHIVGHNSIYRVYLRKAKRGRIAKLIDAPHLPDGECVFQVVEAGIRD